MIFRALNIRGWRCLFYFSIDRYWVTDILNRLRELQAPPSILQRVERNMLADSLNTGFTYSNPTLRSSVVVIGRSSSGAEFLNSFVHELRHLTDDIAYTYGYPLRGEPAAYLNGDISLMLSDIVCTLTCNECRKSFGK